MRRVSGPRAQREREREKGRAPSYHSSPGSSLGILRNLTKLTIAKLSRLGIHTCCTGALSFAGKGYCKQAGFSGEKESINESWFSSVSNRHASQTSLSRRRNVLLIQQKRP